MLRGSVMTEVGKHVAVPTGNVQELQEEMTHLGTYRQQLLGGETGLRTWIDDRAAAIKREVSAQHVSRNERREALPVLDPVVLTWRHSRHPYGVPVPKLALIEIQATSKAEFYIHQDGHTRHLTVAGDPYADVMAGLQRWRRRADVHHVELTYTYTGTIPPDIRTTIRDEAPNFSKVFLLADAPLDSWEAKRGEKIIRPKIRHLDPLVLGYLHDTFVVLGKFDPTPLEEYVAAEFTHRQLGA